jgi:cytochrome c-type biogenesis protein CcmE
MNKRWYYLAGIALLVGFAGFSLMSFNQALTPYVSYSEARATPRAVQVAGGLVKASSSYDEATAALRFQLTDPTSKDTIRVRYHGLRPANFEDAISIVAIGRYDAAAQELHADKLLVKCPSKYQGIEKIEEKTYG